MDPIYIVGALVAAIYALVEAIKWRNNKKNGNQNGNFTHDDRQRLYQLYRQHQQMDEDGTPLWYMPRSMVAAQSKQAETLGNILTELRLLNKTMGRWSCPYDAKRGG